MPTTSRQPPPHLYLAVTAAGKRQLGIRQARSERALAESLRASRQVLLRSWELPAWLASEKSLKLKDHAILNEQLAQLLARGVPLVEALDVTAQTVRAAAADTVARIRDLVAEGASFADACRRVGGFDPVTVAIYRAAERTGDLAGATAQLGRSARRQLAIAGKAVTLMIYPLIVLMIGLGVSVLMLMWIVPKIGTALTQAQADLPALTRAIMGLGELLRSQWLIVLVVVVAGVVGVLIARKPIGRSAMRLARRLPLMRDVLMAQETAGFFSVMAAMTRSGVPLADALSVSIGSIGHAGLRGELTHLRNRLVEGGVLRELIDEVKTLPLPTRRLLIAAERAGDLESAFDTLADDMSEEVEKRSSRLLAALEPALLLVLFGVIGTLMLSIMIPLISATSQAF